VLTGISLQLFYSLVWGGERLTSELRGLPENLPTISKSADLSRKVPIGSQCLDSTYKVTGITCGFREFGTFSERSVDFEIGGRFSGRHLDPDVSLSPPHTRL
jgi:hypothetical protein